MLKFDFLLHPANDSSFKISLSSPYFQMLLIMTIIRENTSHWKVKEIDPVEQRSRGYCPLTPKEVGIFLAALGYPPNTPIYIAAGEIYGGDSRMAGLRARYPTLMRKVIAWLSNLMPPLFLTFS